MLLLSLQFSFTLKLGELFATASYFL